MAEVVREAAGDGFELALAVDDAVWRTGRGACGMFAGDVGG